MKPTNQISEEILNILTPYSEFVFSNLKVLDDLAEFEWDRHHKHTTVDYDFALSEEYLEGIVNSGEKHVGFPEHKRCIDIGLVDQITYPGDWMDKVIEHSRMFREVSTELSQMLGARNQAVNVYYPSGGFMGWHNNWNAYGYNILLSYNEVEGGGVFKYLDPVTKEVVTMPDKKGWSCKVGYYGSKKEPEKIYYHCAGSTTPRITLGFIVPELDMWRDMIEDISGEDASHFS